MLRCRLALFLLVTFIVTCIGFTINGVPGKIYTIEVNDVTTKRIAYNTSTSRVPFRVNVWRNDTGNTANESVLVVLAQKTKVTSWQLPYILPTSNSSVVGKYNNISNILCYDEGETSEAEFESEKRNFTVSLSTTSSKTITAYVYVDMFESFFIEENKKYEAHVSPNRPIHYSFDFPKNFRAETVALKVLSEREACVVVSIQQKLCPVEDMNFERAPGDMFHTVKTKGGLHIWKYLFPNGFFLVFNVKADNQSCNSEQVPIEKALFPSNHRVKISFEIIDGRTKNQYFLSTIFIIIIHLIIVHLIGFLIIFWIWYEKGGNYVEVDNAAENKWKFFCHTFAASGFYIMPVLQLMVFYKMSVDDSGNLDKCYYNYWCSNPWYFNDFNHMFSNICYWFLGAVFLVVAKMNSNYLRNSPFCGVQRPYGLYYAMGLALILEGTLSCAYHICPNQSNFQFDTSFMYVMVVLVIAKLYQNRHYDQMNKASYLLFFLLAIIVILVSMETSTFPCNYFICLASKYISITIFNIFHVILFLYIGYKNYYRGIAYIEMYRGNQASRRLIESDDEDETPEITLRKAKRRQIGNRIIKEKRGFAIIEILINSALLFCVSLVYMDSMDFATYILIILIVNAIMYCIYYIRMKVCAEEKLHNMAKWMGGISLVTWCFAGYFFLNNVSKWSLTPAESRELNSDCYTFLHFYDSHDVWHLLSALALFFSFLFLLVLDDDLLDQLHYDGVCSF